MYMHLTEMGWSLGFGPQPEWQVSVFSHIDEQWKGDAQSGCVDIQRSMDRRRIELLWAKVAQHRHGQGMEQGVDLTVIRKHYCVLVNRGAMARAGALMAIGAGALWPEMRIQEEIPGKEDYDTACKKCGYPRKHEAHMFWGCPPINALPKASIRRIHGRYFDHETGAIWGRHTMSFS